MALHMLDNTELLYSVAKAAGHRRYLGRHCPYGHDGERFVSTRGCVQCTAERALAYKRADPERAKRMREKWITANPERFTALKAASQKRNRSTANARNRRWYAKDLLKSRAQKAAWQKANPEKECAKAARYRADRLQRTPLWADHEAMGMMYAAAQIARITGFDAEVDHIVPLRGDSVSGLHVHGNLQLISSAANKAKANLFAQKGN